MNTTRTNRTRVRKDRLVALIILIALNVSAFAFAPASAANDLMRSGRWSAPFWEGGAEPYDPPSAEKSRRFPVAAALMALPDGRVLYWNGLEGSENGDVWVIGADGWLVEENARVRLLDVLAGVPAWSTSTKERGTTDAAHDHEHGAADDLFCSDQKLLYDGTVLIAGGAEWGVGDDPFSPSRDVHGLKDAKVFDPSTDDFRNVGDMAEGRWYPSLATLSDGKVLVASGVRRLGFGPADGPDPAFSQVKRTETYDPTREKWEDGGQSEWSFPLYPRLHLLPDGTVFYGGAGQSWNPFGETGDQAMWAMRRVYNPATKTWTTLDHARYGVRSGAASAMLRLEPPYDHADILIAGGTSGSAPGTYVASTLSEVVRWTPDGITDIGELKSPVAGLTGDPSQLRNRRWFGVPVMLPTGEVFLTNGGDADDVIDPGSAAAVRTPELYDPETNTWTELASASRDRVYHTSAVLLPDGRVLVGGHAPHPAHYFRHDSSSTRSNNFKDATFEIYQPPYLFRGSRPVIERATPTEGGRALRLIVGSETSASDIGEVVLVRMGANTHSMDADMRAVKLQHSVAGQTISAELPNGGDGRILPPGPYYVFAMSDTADGPVPSVAEVVLIQPAGNGKVIAVRHGAN